MALNPKNLFPGNEQFEWFYSAIAGNVPRIQYDYRHTDGELFSIIAKTLEEARTRKNRWLLSK